jgi:hypothetical protein
VQRTPYWVERHERRHRVTSRHHAQPPWGMPCNLNYPIEEPP